METTEVIICGCGPTGALLSTYLGQHSVKNIVLEREMDIVQDPRGIALDEDGIRCLQRAGIYDRIFTEIGQVMGYFNFVSGATSLHEVPFLRFNYNTIEGGTAHPGFMCHKQPSMEKCLRDVISTQGDSELRLGCRVVSIEEVNDYVIVMYTTTQGEQRQLRAKFLVGADGKTGFTRKQYLETKGITMEKDEKFKYEEAWVALNMRVTLPTQETHPEFPLWKLGFSPEQVYNSFFPPDFRFICNPDRPSVCGRFGLPADRLWRYEFVLKPGEDGPDMATYERLREVVFPYLTHAGEMHGLDAPVTFPEDCMEILRSRPFTFSGRSCNKWALGRVILCGDSAHVFPPFGGQGIASGFRDALSLAWRLKIACRPGFSKYGQLFQAWYSERKQQLEKSLAATIRNGNYCNERSVVKMFFRNWSFWLMQLVPSWSHQLELGQRQEGMTRYTWAPGFPFLPFRNGGRNMPQVFCMPCGPLPKRPLFTDDVIFAGGKTGLFQLVLLLDDYCDVSGAREDLAHFSCTNNLHINEATLLVHGSRGEEPNKLTESSEQDVFQVIESVESFPGIWDGLPNPLHYDGSRLRREMQGRFIIVRPDSFVYAVCQNMLELDEAVKSLDTLFGN